MTPLLPLVPDIPTDRPLFRSEFVCLLVLAAALPLVEIPKNLAWLGLVLAWLFNSLRSGNFGRAAPAWNCAFAALWLAPLISIAAAPWTRHWDELGNHTILLVTGALLVRTRVAARQRLALAGVLIAATLAGIGHGVWAQHARGRAFIELHSVGHVNHSAIYGVGVALLAAALALACWSRARAAARAALLFANLALFGTVFAWQSRGALLAYLAGLLVLGAAWLRACRAPLWPALLGLVVACGVALALNPAVLEKTRRYVAAGYLSAERVPALRTSLELWRQQPWSGAGAGNFDQASPERVQAWRAARGEPFEATDFLFTNHGHSLYFNTLAERGLVGLLALVCLGLPWLRWLLRGRPDAATPVPALAWLGWGAGLAGFVVVFVAGLFNTTLHHEHGLLAMLLLGLMVQDPRA